MKTILAWMAASWAMLIFASNIVFADAPVAAPLGLGERDQVVVSVGSGLVQQEQFYGYLESLLIRRFPERKIVCRNLGWSGDTVWGEARTGGYKNPAGFERLKKQMAELKPDVILVGYGSVESFDGPAGLDHFKDGYGKLLDALIAMTPRIALISPAFHEDLGRPTPDPTAHNQNLHLYTEAIRAIAAERRLPFVDLFRATVNAKHYDSRVTLTSNGIQLHAAGYWLAGQEIELQLGLRPEQCDIELNRDGQKPSVTGAVVTDVQATPQRIAFRAVANLLPCPPPPDGAVPLTSWPELAGRLPVVRIHGLADGQWVLKIDGQFVFSASASEWNAGAVITGGPDLEQAKELRELVVSRSKFFYRRWNPTNDIPQHYTYIAPDYAMFDAKVAELDEAIAQRCKPVAHLYEISSMPVTKQ